jgi:hypothetical protein
MSKRKLKIESMGDSTRKYRHAPPVTIRLKGQWLAQLGFEPGKYVDLIAVSPGVLEIRLCDTRPPSREFQIAAMRLDHAIAADQAGRGKA